MCIHAVKHLDRNQKWNRFHCIYICDDVYISTTDTVFTKIQLKVSRLLFFFLYAMSLWILLSITGTFVNMCPGNIQKYFNYYNHNLLHFKIKRTNEDENPFTVFWLQLLCELFGQDVVILLTSKSMRKNTCLNQRLCQGGGLWALPRPHEIYGFQAPTGAKPGMIAISLFSRSWKGWRRSFWQLLLLTFEKG